MILHLQSAGITFCWTVRCSGLWVYTSVTEATDTRTLFILIYFIREFKTGSCQTGMQSHMQISQQALYASILFHQNYTFIRLSPPASLLHHFTLICLPHISKSLFIGIYQGFYHFSYKKDGEYFPFFLQCCSFMAENWRNFRSLYFSFLTVTLACHYWGFLCPPVDLKLRGPSTGETKGTSCTHFSSSISLSFPLSSSLFFSSFHAWPDLATSWHYQ